jgi:hypothetical protein
MIETKQIGANAKSFDPLDEIRKVEGSAALKFHFFWRVVGTSLLNFQMPVMSHLESSVWDGIFAPSAAQL